MGLFVSCIHFANFRQQFLRGSTILTFHEIRLSDIDGTQWFYIFGLFLSNCKFLLKTKVLYRYLSFLLRWYLVYKLFTYKTLNNIKSFQSLWIWKALARFFIKNLLSQETDNSTRIIFELLIIHPYLY